ncbi:hypothetical protein [Arsenicicoccus bolidensis]|uniref:hypothetical protein n=1 Tax=Arsenicicoccus bolidensis TaxID=229480 RepID=UPI0028AB41E1|nr:hypothetical protein [Arsenicicoccus bolidensis]
MGYSAARRRSPGRPRLNRDLRQFVTRFEPDLLDALQLQADAVHLSLSSYLVLLLAQVHDYHGQYLAEVEAPLPTAVTVDDLRRTVPYLPMDPRRTSVRVGEQQYTKTLRVDRPLADQIDHRCRELDLAYSEYFRGLFREAAGFPSPEAAGEQQAATISKEGELRLAEAS